MSRNDGLSFCLDVSSLHTASSRLFWRASGESDERHGGGEASTPEAKGPKRP